MGNPESTDNLLVEVVGKQCSRFLENATESAWQEIVQNEWGMGENGKGQAASVLEEGHGPEEASSPAFHSCHTGIWAWVLRVKMGWSQLHPRKLCRIQGCAEQGVFLVLPQSVFILIRCPQGCSTERERQQPKENIPEWPSVPPVNPCAPGASSLQPRARALPAHRSNEPGLSHGT